MGRLFASQFLAALLVWVGYALLSAVDVVEQPDEINYWLRFLAGASAGAGAWDLACRLPRLWPSVAAEPPRLAAIAVLVALPWTLPYWWDPARMDRYFKRSTEPLDAGLRAAGDFLRSGTPARAVMAGDEPFARWAAALAGRRSLLSSGAMMPRDFDRRRAVMRTLFESGNPAAVRAAAASYGVTHLVVTPAVVARYGTTLIDLERHPWLRRVYLSGDPAGEFLAIFEILPAG